MDKLTIKTPAGYLIAEIEGSEGEYPGIRISLSKDEKKYDASNIVAVVEYNDAYKAEDSANGEIQTVTYHKGKEEPSHIVSYKTGEDKIEPEYKKAAFEQFYSMKAYSHS